MIESLLHKIKRLIVSSLHIDTNRDLSRTILVAGAARSGTTWIGDIVNARNDHRLIFEPFHPDKVRLCRHLLRNQYLRPNDRDPRHLRMAHTILSGGVRTRWTDQYTMRLVADQRVVKEIRANLMLGWIRANFPQVPIVLVLRHPCAVFASRKAMNWSVGGRGLLKQRALVDDHLRPFKREMRRDRDRFARHVFQWCAQYYVPLRQLQADEIHLAFYERFCLDPVGEAQRMFAFLKMNWSADLAQRITRPSLVTREGSAVLSGDSLTDAWRGALTEAQIHRAHEILSMFGLDRLYGADAMPRPDAANLCAVPTL